MGPEYTEPEDVGHESVDQWKNFALSLDGGFVGTSCDNMTTNRDGLGITYPLMQNGESFTSSYFGAKRPILGNNFDMQVFDQPAPNLPPAPEYAADSVVWRIPERPQDNWLPLPYHNGKYIPLGILRNARVATRGFATVTLRFTGNAAPTWFWVDGENTTQSETTFEHNVTPRHNPQSGEATVLEEVTVAFDGGPVRIIRIYFHWLDRISEAAFLDSQPAWVSMETTRWAVHAGAAASLCVIQNRLGDTPFATQLNLNDSSGRTNAFRHAYLACGLTLLIGESRARELLRSHEYWESSGITRTIGHFLYGSISRSSDGGEHNPDVIYWPDTVVDLLNNETGIFFGKELSEDGFCALHTFDIRNKIVTALNNGHLWVTDPYILHDPQSKDPGYNELILVNNNRVNIGLAENSKYKNNISIIPSDKMRHAYKYWGLPELDTLSSELYILPTRANDYDIPSATESVSSRMTGKWISNYKFNKTGAAFRYFDPEMITPVDCYGF